MTHTPSPESLDGTTAQIGNVSSHFRPFPSPAISSANTHCSRETARKHRKPVKKKKKKKRSIKRAKTRTLAGHFEPGERASNGCLKSGSHSASSATNDFLLGRRLQNDSVVCSALNRSSSAASQTRTTLRQFKIVRSFSQGLVFTMEWGFPWVSLPS